MCNVLIDWQIDLYNLAFNRWLLTETYWICCESKGESKLSFVNRDEIVYSNIFILEC